MKYKNMAKIHYLISCAYFELIILLETIILIINFVGIDNINFSRDKIFYLIPISLILFAFAIVFSRILNYHGKIKNPETIIAKISEIKKVKIFYGENGELPSFLYYIKCIYKYNGKQYIYKSDFLFTDPENYLKKNDIKQINVIVDRDNYKKYFVNLNEDIIKHDLEEEKSKIKGFNNLTLFIFAIIISIIMLFLVNGLTSSIHGVREV